MAIVSPDCRLCSMESSGTPPRVSGENPVSKCPDKEVEISGSAITSNPKEEIISFSSITSAGVKKDPGSSVICRVFTVLEPRWPTCWIISSIMDSTVALKPDSSEPRKSGSTTEKASPPRMFRSRL
ncbi:hypothetical protein D3C75_952130 [compost metagenome]